MGKDLTSYGKKRDFRRTPEPGPDVAPAKRSGPPVFVIHRHEATHLHYDLRLEMAGTLKSFAVPRGFSYVPSTKHLAVRTEDHPLAYEDFSGVIPKGQYGAGTMTIWDRGTWSFLGPGDDPVAALAEGKLEVRLDGRRLRGEWHLVKTTRSERDWLLFKARDEWARGEDDPPYPFDVDLSAAKRARFPRPPKPMLPGEEAEPFSDPAWMFELDFEGRRVFAEKRGEAIRLRGAGDGRILHDPPADIVEAVGSIRAEQALLDGVLVAPDDSERPSRDLLQSRLAGAEGPVLLYAFDLLHVDGWQVKALPLLSRKRLLASILPTSSRLLHVDHVLGEGERLAAAVARVGLGGLVAKRSDSTYRGGAAAAWRRIPVEPAEVRGPKKLSRALARPSRRGGRFRTSNLSKVFWPEAGLTKGDLLDYMEGVAEMLLPHLHDRPVHMQRFPDGIEGKSFYHKDVPDHAPDWVVTEPIPSGEDGRTIRYVICNDRDTLLWLANLGSVDLHPWMSRRGSLDTPDYVVFDLDPKSAPFADVVRTARLLGRLLRGIGLRPGLKTSGASGLHIVVGLEPRYTYDLARMFAEMIARAVVNENPDLCTVERSVGRRGGRVYVDVMQNRRGQTVVPPYVPRPVPAASVSTPLDWDELTVDLDPAAFTIRTAPARIAARGDLFRAVLDDRQALEPAIEAFQDQWAGE